MISNVSRFTSPVGIFAGGTELSGGQTDPEITANFIQSASEDAANYPYGIPPKFSTTNGLVQSAGLSAVAINKASFKSKVSGIAGTYTFISYDDSGTTRWRMESLSVIDPVDISQYGLTISGTVVPGEGMVIQYVQGDDEYTVTLVNIIRTYVVQNVAKKFLLGDMNLIGHIGTLQQYRRQMGGIRTYDPGFAAVINGYPRGSQLEYLQSVTEDGVTRHYLRKVLSLIDDNTYDFVEDPSYIDNVHWMFCDVLTDDLPTLPSTDLSPQIICWFIFSKANESLNTTYSATLSQDSYLTASISPSWIQQANGNRIAKISIDTTLNGVTKRFAYANQINNVSWIEPIYYGNGSIVKKGTTVSVSISAYNYMHLSVSVFAFPAATSSMTRI